MRNPIIPLALVAGLMLGMTTLAGQGQDFKRERGGATAAAKDALEGKAPPVLQISEWLNTNGKALDWKALRGNVVVLDFWAYW